MTGLQALTLTTQNLIADNYDYLSSVTPEQRLDAMHAITGFPVTPALTKHLETFLDGFEPLEYKNNTVRESRELRYFESLEVTG